MRQTSFSQSIIRHKQQLQTYKKVICDISLPQDDYLPLDRAYERFPYVPSSSSERDIRCYESYQIQVQALIKRLSATKIKRAVLGISGGLDSTQALIVTAKAFDQLGYSREQILAYTMPGFATSERTLTQAHRLMKALGCSSHQIDIRPSCMQMLEDIDHPYSRGEAIYDITFENVQAGERTSHLFRLANMHDAIVIGTGDLSELALGWCTYGVGDHMSHYNVNASIPKTLIQHLIRWVTYSKQFGDEVSEVLCDILGTEISPELVPSQGEYQLQPSQRTEDVIGPYELQDFHLYYTLRYGYSPVKIAFLAYHTWADRNRGIWPKDIPVSKRNQYDLASIKQHLGTFLYRFFEISQFKRSCVPNAPKVGSGGSLSPRGDYRAPSDSKANIWLAQITNIPDQSPDPK
jgi:NAD+ synthase (glutamine-hydrolysing)